MQNKDEISMIRVFAYKMKVWIALCLKQICLKVKSNFYFETAIFI